MPKRPASDKYDAELTSIGISVPLPQALAKTRAEKKQAKVLQKKERTQRVKAALEELAERRAEVEEHKAFTKEESEKEKEEKRVRKLELKAEHIRARNQRDEQARQRDAELRKRQAEMVAEELQHLRRRAKADRKLRRLIAADTAAAEAVAPKAVHVPVQRDPEIQKVRESLPVVAEEQPIVEAIHESAGNATIICGETGSGKTTQVPQFLWEAGFGQEAGAVAHRSGMIAVTEPRRVAAISMAQRVAQELNEGFGDTVCYHVRYQNNLSPQCRLKFMTEGILLKEMQSDFLLRRYSAVVIDEAHERSVSCDILVGLLSRVVPLRESLFRETKGEITPLRLVIMSATLRVTDFRDNARLFPHVPRLVEVPVRRFPVTTHYSRKTEMRRYVDEAFKKVRQLHKKLPPGGVLIFLSTQREIDQLCNLLRAHYRRTRIVYDDERYSKHSMLANRKEGPQTAAATGASAAQDDGEDEDAFGLRNADYALHGDEDAPADAAAGDDTFEGATGLADDFDYGATRKARDSDSDDDAEARVARTEAAVKAAAAKAKAAFDNASVSDWDDDEDDGAEDNVHDAADEGDGEEDEDEVPAAPVPVRSAEAALFGDGGENEADGALDTLHILPLYSLLDHRSQQRVFEPPPKGKRLCVVATNIAETSITIPNVRYVIDAGRVKNKTLQPDTQATTFKIQWISQAAAEQRSGRAGRVGPGHCYRLYSTAVYANQMPKHADPEILRTPLESVVLMMKHLRIDHVGNFPFPTPPDSESIRRALHHLRAIGALCDAYRCTPLGGAIAALPVTPRFGRMIIDAVRRFHSKAPDVVAAMLTVAAVANTTMDVFALGGTAQPPKALLHPGSDFVTFYRVFAAFAQDTSVGFSARLGLVHKSLQEAAMLRRQIEALIAEADPHAPAPKATDDGEPAPLGPQDGVALADFDANEVMLVGGDAPAAAEEAEAIDKRPRAERPRAEHPAEGGTSTQVRAAAADAGDEDEADTLADLNVPQLSREHELVLRRLFIVGLIDQVCRRATISECRTAGVKYDDSKTSRVPYFDCTRRAIVFIHPSSSIAATHPPPEWVVYTVLQRSQRVQSGAEGRKKEQPKTFMRGLTIVSKPWLDEAGFDEVAAADAGEQVNE